MRGIPSPDQTGAPRQRRQVARLAAASVLVLAALSSTSAHASEHSSDEAIVFGYWGSSDFASIYASVTEWNTPAALPRSSMLQRRTPILFPASKI